MRLLPRRVLLISSDRQRGGESIGCHVSSAIDVKSVTLRSWGQPTAIASTVSVCERGIVSGFHRGITNSRKRNMAMGLRVVSRAYEICIPFRGSPQKISELQKARAVIDFPTTAGRTSMQPGSDFLPI